MDLFTPVGKALSNVATSSPSKRASSSVQRVLNERMTLSEAIEAVTEMIGRYANGGAQAGDSYIGALAATLCSYPRQVAMRCASRTGVTAQCKFLPTDADVIAWCERDTAPLYRDAEREYRLKEQFELREQATPTDESRARVEAMRLEVHRTAICPAEMSVRSEENERKAAASRDKRLHGVRSEWGEQEPPTIAGTPVSRELVESMQRPAQ